MSQETDLERKAVLALLGRLSHLVARRFRLQDLGMDDDLVWILPSAIAASLGIDAPTTPSHQFTVYGLPFIAADVDRPMLAYATYDPMKEPK